MLKQVVSIILVPFVPNFLGDRKLAKNQYFTAQIFGCSELSFYDEVIFHKNPPRQVIGEEEMEKKGHFSKHCTLSNDSSATLNAFFLQSQIPYKSILHGPWRCSLVQHPDFVLAFKEKTISGRAAELAVLSQLALLSTICTSREGFFL